MQEWVHLQHKILKPFKKLTCRVLSGVALYESVKTKEKSSWVISKVVAVAYESFSSQSLNHSSKGVAQSGRNQNWSVAYESSRKESFDSNDVILRAELGKKNTLL